MSEYRGYKIEFDGMWGLRVIKPLSKGSVPNELRGVFTTEAFAIKTIDLFLKDKDVKNGRKANDIT